MPENLFIILGTQQDLSGRLKVIRSFGIPLFRWEVTELG